MSVVVSVIFGFILLVAVTFAIPGEGAVGYAAVHRPAHLAGLDGHQVGRVPASSSPCVAQCFCTIASTTSASRMMFAFSRDRAVPGASALAARVQARPDSRLHGLGDLRAGFPDAAAGALVGLRRLLRLDGGCRDRPLHRLRDADHPPAACRRVVRAHGLEPRQVLQDRWTGSRSSGSSSSASSSCCPPTRAAFRSSRTSTGTSSTTRRSRSSARSCSSAAGTSLSARKWFKGPVRQGTDEELAQIEAGFETPAAPATSPAGQA